MKTKTCFPGAVLGAVFILCFRTSCVCADTGWGTALSFDGTDDHVVVPVLTAFPSTALTLEFWIKTSGSDPSETPLSYCAGAGDNALVIGGGLEAPITVNNVTTASNFGLQDGAWHHFAMTWSRAEGALKVYRDGALVSEQSNVASGTAIPGGGTLVLGQRQTEPGGGFEVDQAFLGGLDEVRVWNVVRTAEEIQSLMWQPLRGGEPGLVAHWSLDEGSGATAYDSTPAALAATLVNDPIWVTDTAPLRLLYVTGMQPIAPQQWTFRFVDAGTGSTNYVLQFLPDLSSDQVWTDLNEVDIQAAGDGMFEAEASQLPGQQGFIQVRGVRSVRVNLSSASAAITEGAGTDYVTLVFDSPFVGTVNYSLGGPDTDSVEALTGSVAVHGTRAHIPIIPRDDLDMSELRYLTLTLEDGDGYHVGGSGRQTVTIEDNDAEWQGSLFLPTGVSSETTSLVDGEEVTVPLNTQATIDFVLGIQQSGGGYQAALKSEGYGFFSTNPVPAQIVFGPDQFAVTVPDIPMAASCTLLDAPMNLTLQLTAQNDLPDQLVSQNRVKGVAMLAQEVTGQPHLNTTQTGTFELRSPAVRPSTYEVELVP